MPLKTLLAATFSLYASGVMAWGNEGHQTVALIAEATLTPAARAQVKSILALEGDTSLAQVASWADEIKNNEPGLVSHAVRIPFDADNYDPKRDCSGRGKCVVYGIEHFEEELKQPDTSPAEQLRALKFLVHFVGDVHQPLHAIQETGGMQAQVGKRQYALHKIWDTIAIRAMKTPPPELARQLLATHAQVPQLTPEDWAVESHDIAKRYIYSGNKQRADLKAQMAMPQDYLGQISPTIKERLTAAGIRLGRLLNDIYK